LDACQIGGRITNGSRAQAFGALFQHFLVFAVIGDPIDLAGLAVFMKSSN